MFYVNKNAELTPDLLYKMINKFNINVVPKLQKYKNYKDGKQAILSKSYADASKPCNRVVTNYCADIVSSYNGYIASPGYISYTSDNDIESIMDCLRYNDYQDEDADFLNDALIYGVAAELMYTDERGQVRFRLIEPTTCFGIYDDSLTGDLMYFVRMYRVNDWDDSDLYNVDVYSDYNIKHYQMHGKMGGLEVVGEEPHFFNQCPANVFYLDKDECNIFDCIITLQDAYNELLSGEIDDFSAFCDAYLTITGCDALPDDVAEMKENRTLILPTGATVDYTTKNVSDTQIENILKRVHDNIYRIAKCPDFSSEQFVGGVSSGVAIRYRLTGCETRAATIESNMKKALQRRIELIAGVASLKLGEEIFRDIQITFKRNIPEDYTSLVNIVNALKGTVSDETLLSMIPQVTDVQAELDRVQEQKQKNMELYSFGNSLDDDEE